MTHGLALPCVCATNQCYFAQWFGYLNEIMIHPHLENEARLLGLWIASECANTLSPSCSYSYHQLSLMLNKPARIIQHALLSLRYMGFLSTNIPIWYNEPTDEMRNEPRVLTLIFPPKTFYKEKKELLANQHSSASSKEATLPQCLHLLTKKECEEIVSVNFA
jgi:hypothetical protein